MSYPITAFIDTPTQMKNMRSGVGLVLNQEGLVNDLAFYVNRKRREMNYNVTDRIELVLVVSPEMWWAIHFNEDELKAKTLTESIVFEPELTATYKDLFTRVVTGDKDNQFVVYLHTRYWDGYRL